MRPLLLSIFLLVFTTGLAQNYKVKGGLSTTDTADITILNIYPDSFPNVSVVFRAETRRGEPVWSLTKEKMKVYENGQNCSVISVEPISKNNPITIGVVIDHSGSMGSEFAYLFDSTYDSDLDNSPINNAKAAVASFISSFNFTKDAFSVIGFSSRVDRQLPPTKDVGKINAIVDSMYADSSTALYDAMAKGIEQIASINGIKVLVVLTDGHDNSSSLTVHDVINAANKNEVPVYIIGLGFVNTDTLQLIARATKGQFYHTQSSSSLNTIYSLISKKVQSYYNLVYTSSNLSSTDSGRVIELSFDIDSIYLVSNADTMHIPADVISFMQAKETRKEYLLYGGLAVGILVGAGLLFFFFLRKQDKRPVIKNLFPNPTSTGIINIQYESPNGKLEIHDPNGIPINITNISKEVTQVEVDLSQFINGYYVAVIIAEDKRSNSVRFIINH